MKRLRVVQLRHDLDLLPESSHRHIPRVTPTEQLFQAKRCSFSFFFFFCRGICSDWVPSMPLEYAFQTNDYFYFSIQLVFGPSDPMPQCHCFSKTTRGPAGSIILTGISIPPEPSVDSACSSFKCKLWQFCGSSIFVVKQGFLPFPPESPDKDHWGGVFSFIFYFQCRSFQSSALELVQAAINAGTSARECSKEARTKRCTS